MGNKYTKSPFNWVGNKYKQLPQLIQLFPPKIRNFIDLFTGGADVSINVTSRAEHVYANDINKLVIDIMREFQTRPLDDILQYVDARVAEYGLTKDNKENYFAFREAYNNGTCNSPLDLFTLTRFSYNNNFRFNDNNEMNQAFGDRYFNPVMRKNTVAFYTLIKNVNLSSVSFKDFDLNNFGTNDFIYADPPYLIADAFYNTGARNAAQKWVPQDDLELFNCLDGAAAKGIKFAMSNFIHHRGKSNQKLIEWINDNEYNTFDVNSDYSRCVANKIKDDNPTLEVVITNYENGTT